MQYLRKCIRRLLAAVGLQTRKPKPKPKRARPERRPYVRGGGGSGTAATLAALEAILNGVEEIIRRLPDPDDEDAPDP